MRLKITGEKSNPDEITENFFKSTPVTHEVFKMAADKGEGTSRKWRKSDNVSENHIDSEEEEEPDFSDSEDYIDDINDEG